MPEKDGNNAEHGHTRKLAAILAADVAGYSRLMADDEGATVTTLTEYRTVFSQHVTSHKGRIVDTAGDSVLATFDSVVEAVEAAVAVQQDLAEANEPLPGHRKMHFRIGVNLGDIIVREDATVYGDGVNVAARLEGLAEPGGVMVSEDAYRQVEGKLDVGLEDAGEHEVKNIAKPVGAYRVLLDGSEATSPGKSLASKGIASRPKLVAGLVAVLAVVVGVAVWGLTIRVEAPQMVKADGTPTDDPVLAMPFGPTIAVLPFKSENTEEGHEYFADGITEDIIGRLSRFRNVLVIARNSTAQYKGKSVDVRDIGRDLNAGYVVEGSVRRSEGAVRVAVRLLDTSDGTAVWSETYDHDLSATKLFDIQDEITETIAATIGSPFGLINTAESKQARNTPPVSIDAYDCWLLWTADSEYGPAEHLETRTCAEKAVVEEPAFAKGWIVLAVSALDEARFGLNPLPNSLDRALDAARKAVELDPQDEMGRFVLNQTLFARGEVDAFFVEAERTFVLNPNNSTTLAGTGDKMIWAGQLDRGMAMMRKAIALNPHHPSWYYWGISTYHYLEGEYEEALKAILKTNWPDFPGTYEFKAAIYGQLSRMEEARDAVTQLLEIYPEYVENYPSDLEAWNWPPEAITHWTEGLEKAGLFDEPQAPSRPVIAVLPFENMSGDPEQEYFADGIAEGIINALSQFDGINVISRTSTFQFRDKTMDVRVIGEELNANYLVSGSVQRSSGGIRVSVQLIDAKDSNQIWSDVYDRDLSVSNIFELQDNIVATVAAQVGGMYGVVMNDIAFPRRGDSEVSMPGYECILLTAAYYRIPDKDEHLRVRDCLERTVSQDPSYAEAWRDLAFVYLDEAISGYNPLPDPVPRSLEAALTAIRLEPHSAAAHIGLAWAASFAGDWATTKKHIDEAFRLNPRDAWVLNLGGLIYAHLAEWEKSLGLAKKGQRLNPLGPGWLNWVFVHYYFAMGDYEQALAYSRQLDEPDRHWPYAHIASALGHLGRMDEAEFQLKEALKLEPNLGGVFWEETRFFFPTQGSNQMIENVRSGLQKAGLHVPEEPEVVQ
jgi:adenylate cyclase